MSVKVKRLEWVDREGYPPPSWCAETGFGEYVIGAGEGIVEAILIMHGVEEERDVFYTDDGVSDLAIGDAMEACQSHFAELVLECLEVDNDPE